MRRIYIESYRHDWIAQSGHASSNTVRYRAVEKNMELQRIVDLHTPPTHLCDLGVGLDAEIRPQLYCLGHVNKFIAR